MIKFIFRKLLKGDNFYSFFNLYSMCETTNGFHPLVIRDTIKLFKKMHLVQKIGYNPGTVTFGQISDWKCTKILCQMLTCHHSRDGNSQSKMIILLKSLECTCHQLIQVTSPRACPSKTSTELAL